MRLRLATAGFALAAAALAGCGNQDGKQPPFPDVHPVKGVVKKGGQPVKGGSVRFIPDPETNDFITDSNVNPDGTYNLVTIRATDRRGEQKAGAPAGRYKVLYMPPGGDQTSGGSTEPVELPNPVTVEAKENNIPIDLPKR